jgi:hypothetical protein
MEKFNSGWHNGVRQIDVRVNELNARSGETETIDLYRGVTGDYFDVGLVLSGEPECWYQFETQETPSKEITVWVNMSAVCSQNQKNIYNRGAVICNLIDKLRKEYFVKIIFCFGGNSQHGYKYESVEIRMTMDTRNGYSRSLLAFCTAHPGLLRRCYFAVLEIEQGKN